ncbi:acireductone dioxygenase (Ni2+-requiring) [Ascoidea rubescens DSM 1968]|uniref:Acireductone dioxygenase n=1 Tax=Ascoidea rubescens DSM 1968 TaxID=1344418 RepID=A0A1D2VJP2_9ASCO|nr:Acireductone dioxygenase [Ascoidea rubescens DSM 1968]ODV61836.1 Acireductone dioxygenase [Ascoidea rubescens DSM 1968]
MKAYIYDEEDLSDYQNNHDSGIAVSEKNLNDLGVLYFNYSDLKDVDSLAKERNYRNRDQIVLNPQTENLKQKLDMFIKEHIHEDEEIRYIIDGSGFFDVRSADEKWIRCKVEKNDLLILPSGIFHRFTLDSTNYVKALRLFQDEPKWVALNRPVDLSNQYRKQYEQKYLSSITV